MPIKGIIKKVPSDGGEMEKDVFEVIFSNGALEQLNDFKDFYKADSLDDVIKLAMSFLQRIKEANENNVDNTSKN